jgi:hypothetical protein
MRKEAGKWRSHRQGGIRVAGDEKQLALNVTTRRISWAFIPVTFLSLSGLGGAW